jgi:hypothetical protein
MFLDWGSHASSAPYYNIKRWNVSLSAIFMLEKLFTMSKSESLHIKKKKIVVKSEWNFQLDQQLKLFKNKWMLLGSLKIRYGRTL